MNQLLGKGLERSEDTCLPMFSMNTRACLPITHVYSRLPKFTLVYLSLRFCTRVYL